MEVSYVEEASSSELEPCWGIGGGVALEIGGERWRNALLRRLRETSSCPGLQGFQRWSVNSFSGPCPSGILVKTNYTF